MGPRRVVAFAPGRANLIGEHTDYNDGLSLPFAIEQGVRVAAEAADGDELLVTAADHDDRERFRLSAEGAERSGDWRDFVRGAIGELTAAGVELRGGELAIEGTVPEGAGLSSSAALAVALCLALRALAGTDEPGEPVALARLPEPLDRRVRHVLEENARVDAAVAALEAGDLAALGALLDASHASLRDLYDVSTGAVERTVECLRAAGASGARMMGGGFGGAVIALLPPGVEAPAGATEVAPAEGARLLVS